MCSLRRDVPASTGCARIDGINGMCPHRRDVPGVQEGLLAWECPGGSRSSREYQELKRNVPASTGCARIHGMCPHRRDVPASTGCARIKRNVPALKGCARRPGVDFQMVPK